MAAPVATTNTVQTNAILGESFRRTVWLNASNSRLDAAFSNALKQTMITVVDNSFVRDRTREQLEAGGVTWTSNEVTIQEFEKFYFDGGAQVPYADMRVLEAGGRLESHAGQILGKKLALHVDSKIAGAVTASANYTSGRNNQVAAPDASTITRAFPHRVAGNNADRNIVRAVKDAHLLLTDKDVMEAEWVGDNAPSAFSLMCNYPVARVLVDYLSDVGELRMKSDVAGQAETSRGIFGTTAYMGSFSGFDIVSTNSIAKPGAGQDWKAYVVPTNSSIVAGFPMLKTVDKSWDKGTTNDAYVWQRHAIGEWYAGIVYPENIIEITVKGS